MKKYAMGLCLCLCTFPLFALSNLHHTYTVEAYGFNAGVAKSDFTQKGANYEYHFSVKSTIAFIPFISEEVSRGTLSNNEVSPSYYLQTEKNFGDKTFEELQFIRGQKKILGKTNRSIWQLPLSPSTLQDNLSFQIALRSDLKSHKTPLSYSIIDGEKIRHYEFQVQGKRKLTIGTKTYSTIEVKRNESKPKNYTEFWVAPALDYAMVQIQKVKNGKVIFLAKINP